MSREAISYDVALSHKKPILIEFYADWCTTCQSLAPTLLALHDEFSAEIDFVTIDIDDPQWSQPIEQFHVTGVPQLTLLQVDRSIADTFIGKVPKSILMDRLQVLVSSSVSSN
ncbi:MAG: thioredoxin family protein [Cyanobacteria bacterium SID2]|nr:thioredoxin family protein [Cyanobacteria bacterium SID2]MBP0003759.1 thioredoxin family protein [Cyanobacteria bacterium SBC]